MANAQAFYSGYDQGFQRAQEPRLRKQALSDEEHAQKINDQIALRSSNMEKLRNTPKVLPDGKPNPEYDAAHKGIFDAETSLRTLYHPENHPNAIAKFGHLLTDHLKITSPEQRAGAEQRKNVQNLAGDEKTTQQFAAALPPSDIEQAHRDVQAKMAGLQDQLNQSVKLWDENNKDATPEQRERAHKEISDSLLWGYKPSATSERGNWETLTGTKGGQKTQYRHNKFDNTNTDMYGNELSGDFFEGFVPDSKASTGKKTANDYLIESYISSLHSNAQSFDELTPDQKANWPKYLNSLKQRYGSHQAQVADRDGNIHIINLESSSGPVEVFRPGSGQPAAAPGGAAQPVTAQPKGPGAQPAGGAGASAAPRVPRRNIGGRPAPQVKNDIMLNFKKATPSWNDAQKKYQDANRISIEADRWINVPAGQRSEADKNFVLALIRSEAGRVNQQEIQMMFTAGGAAEFLPRVEANLTAGELPDDLRQQLYDFVHLQKDAAQEVLKQMDQPASGTSNPQQVTGGFDWNSAPEHH